MDEESGEELEGVDAKGLSEKLQFNRGAYSEREYAEFEKSGGSSDIEIKNLENRHVEKSADLGYCGR